MQWTTHFLILSLAHVPAKQKDHAKSNNSRRAGGLKFFLSRTVLSILTHFEAWIPRRWLNHRHRTANTPIVVHHRRRNTRYSRRTTGHSILPSASVDEHMQDPNHDHLWGHPSFVDMLGNQPSRSQMYFEEDDERDFSKFETLCELSCKGSEESTQSSPVVPIALEKYHSLFQQWKGALLLKLLGTNVSFWILEQRMRSLWNLQHGCELIDLEQGFFMTRFYSREDYFRVLEGGPWIILGHYLTVSKWKPNFRPSMQTVQSSLVWIRFLELPLELFDEEILYATGNTLGRTVQIDTTRKKCPCLCWAWPVQTPHPIHYYFRLSPKGGVWRPSSGLLHLLALRAPSKNLPGRLGGGGNGSLTIDEYETAREGPRPYCHNVGHGNYWDGEGTSTKFWSLDVA